MSEEPKTAYQLAPHEKDAVRMAGRKLTDEQVREIRKLKNVYTQKELSEMFGVHRTTVMNIIDRTIRRTA